MIAVLIVLTATIALIGIPALVALSFLGWKIHQALPFIRKIAGTDLSSMLSLPASIDNFQDGLKLLRESVEKYQEGVIKIGEAQVQAVTKLEEAVDRMAQLMFGGSPGDGLKEYDPGKANAVFEEEELVRQGFSREEARGRVAEKEIYSRMKLDR